MSIADAEILKEFLVESYENDRDFVALERDPSGVRGARDDERGREAARRRGAQELERQLLLVLDADGAVAVGSVEIAHAAAAMS